MKWSGKIGWGALAVALTAGIAAHEASACTAILVGKKASVKQVFYEPDAWLDDLPARPPFWIA